MNCIRPSRYLVVAVGIGLTVTLASCGGGGGGSSSMGPTQTPPGYADHALVSDTTSISAMHTDANLVNPWGIVFNPQGFVWVANNETATVTLYDGNGVPQSLVVAIPAGASGPAAPTGIVFNGSTAFSVSVGALSGISEFIFASEGGTISAWSQTVDMTHAVTVYDGASVGAVYKGLAIGEDSVGNKFLYAADFHNAKVDVFNGTFTKVTAAGGFVDASVPAGYAPFGIQNIPGSDGSAHIYVSYAKQGSGILEIVGAGFGYLAVFDATGTLITHLVSGGALNAPWGMAIAPSTFGTLSGDLLVGNLGDGTINAYDPATGASKGAMTLRAGGAVQIPGLWGIAFGNGLNSEPTNTLFYAAGPNGQTDGLYGRIDFDTASTTMPNPGY
jgi:uncharacterized protein (TIGR03118 family)